VGGRVVGLAILRRGIYGAWHCTMATKEIRKDRLVFGQRRCRLRCGTRSWWMTIQQGKQSPDGPLVAPGGVVDDASHNGFSHRDTATAAIYLDDDLGIEDSLQNGRKILLLSGTTLWIAALPRLKTACDRWASTPDRIVGGWLW